MAPSEAAAGVNPCLLYLLVDGSLSSAAASAWAGLWSLATSLRLRTQFARTFEPLSLWVARCSDRAKRNRTGVARKHIDELHFLQLTVRARRRTTPHWSNGCGSCQDPGGWTIPGEDDSISDKRIRYRGGVEESFSFLANCTVTWRTAESIVGVLPRNI